jgi:hypothetical protein
MANPFDYVNTINLTKENMMRGSENDAIAENDYNAFMVNKALSMFPDTIGYANDVNLNYHLDNRPQYEYLINIVRKRKRFAKGGWAKPVKDDTLDAICEVYNCSPQLALEYLKLLDDDQIIKIKQYLQKGGT